MENRTRSKKILNEKEKKTKRSERVDKSLNGLIQEYYSAVNLSNTGKIANLNLNSILKKNISLLNKKKMSLTVSSPTNLINGVNKKQITPLKDILRLTVSRLIVKYNTKKVNYERILMENLLSNKTCHIVSAFKDHLLYDCPEDYLKRFYSKDESIERLPKLSTYYKNYLIFFCKPIFSDFGVSSIIQGYGDYKAEQYYKKNYGVTKKKKKEKTVLKTIFNTTVKKNIEKDSLTMSKIFKNFHNFNFYNSANIGVNNIPKNLRLIKNIASKNIKVNNTGRLKNTPNPSKTNFHNSMNLDDVNNKSLILMKSGLITSRSKENSIANIISSFNQDEGSKENDEKDYYINISPDIRKTIIVDRKKINDNIFRSQIEKSKSNFNNDAYLNDKLRDNIFMSTEEVNKNYLTMKITPDKEMSKRNNLKYPEVFSQVAGPASIKSGSGLNFYTTSNTGNIVANNNFNNFKQNIPIKANNIQKFYDSLPKKHKSTITPHNKSRIPVQIYQSLDINNQINEQNFLVKSNNSKERKIEYEVNDMKMKITLALNLNRTDSRERANDKLSRNMNPALTLGTHTSNRSNNLISFPFYNTSSVANLAHMMSSEPNIDNQSSKINLNNVNININNNINIQSKLSSLKAYDKNLIKNSLETFKKVNNNKEKAYNMIRLLDQNNRQSKSITSMLKSANIVKLPVNSRNANQNFLNLNKLSSLTKTVNLNLNTDGNYHNRINVGLVPNKQMSTINELCSIYQSEHNELKFNAITNSNTNINTNTDSSLKNKNNLNKALKNFKKEKNMKISNKI